MDSQQRHDPHKYRNSFRNSLVLIRNIGCIVSSFPHRDHLSAVDPSHLVDSIKRYVQPCGTVNELATLITSHSAVYNIAILSYFSYCAIQYEGSYIVTI
jgi:hypothetical protein